MRNSRLPNITLSVSSNKTSNIPLEGLRKQKSEQRRGREQQQNVNGNEGGNNKIDFLDTSSAGSSFLCQHNRRERKKSAAVAMQSLPTEAEVRQELSGLRQKGLKTRAQALGITQAGFLSLGPGNQHLTVTFCERYFIIYYYYL